MMVSNSVMTVNTSEVMEEILNIVSGPCLCVVVLMWV